MAREKKVLDASVIAKWFLQESGSEFSLKFKEEHINGEITIVIPDFLFLEVINVLRYKKYSEKDIKIANEDLWKMQMHSEKIDEFLLSKTIEVSIKYNLSIYDAMYAAIAILNGISLITYDKALAKVPNAVLLE